MKLLQAGCDRLDALLIDCSFVVTNQRTMKDCVSIVRCECTLTYIDVVTEDSVVNSSCENRLKETVDGRSSADAESLVPMETGQSVATEARTEVSQV